MQRNSLAFLGSYQAAIQYLKYAQNKPLEIIVCSPSLKLFADFFSKESVCYVVSTEAELVKILNKHSLKTVVFWSYALSDLALGLARCVLRRDVAVHLISPSILVDELVEWADFDTFVGLKYLKSLVKANWQRLAGYPVKLKTYRGYLYACLDLKIFTSILLFREYVRVDTNINPRFDKFRFFILSKYPKAIASLTNDRSICLVLDGNFLMFGPSGRVTLNRKEALAKLVELFDKLKAQQYLVFIKPHPVDDGDIAGIFGNLPVLPKELPLEVLDELVPNGTLVTGFNSSFLSSDHTKNMTLFSVQELLQYLNEQ
jgi:hypothetical protein